MPPMRDLVDVEGDRACPIERINVPTSYYEQLGGHR